VLGPAVIAVNELPDSDKQKPVALAYSNAFRAQYKVAPNTFGASAYDAVMFVKQGIVNANSTDKDKVRVGIESIRNLVGAQGTYTLSPTDHLGLSYDSIRIFQIRNSKFMPIAN
jgi:branched-chain amino acid transport system substrate-binding protein